MSFSSILFYKPILKKIKPSELGYVRPDGAINFQSPESANRYAKNVVVKALNKEKPFERLVLIDDSTIVKQVDGGIDEVTFDSENFHFDTMVHGHPDLLGKGIADPISPQDVVTLYESNQNGAVRSIVYNSAGEYSKVEKLPLPEVYDTIPVESMKEYAIKCKNREELLKAYKIIDDFNEAIKSKYYVLKMTGKMKDFIKDLPDGNFFDNLILKMSIFVTHDLMKHRIPKLNAKYETNFSNLD